MFSAAGTLFGTFTDVEEAHRFAHGLAGTDGVRLPVRVVERGEKPYEVWPDVCGGGLAGCCRVDGPLRPGSYLISPWLVHEDRAT